MKNVIRKLKAPQNRYQDQKLIGKYSLCISEPALRQKIDNFKSLNNDTYHPLYVFNTRRYSTENNNLPMIEGLKDTKTNKKYQHQDEIIKKHFRNQSKNQKLPKSKQKQINEMNFLKNRANQFIKKVSEQRSKLKGRLFFLKQQQIERKNIKQQIESLEKTYIKFQYQSKRRSQAYANIHHLTQKARQRQKKLKSKSHSRQNTETYSKQNKRKSNFISNKIDKHNQSKFNKVGDRNKITKTQANQQEGLNNLLDQQYVNDLQHVRNKLILLNNLMKKEDYYKQKQTHIY